MLHVLELEWRMVSHGITACWSGEGENAAVGAWGAVTFACCREEKQKVQVGEMKRQLEQASYIVGPIVDGLFSLLWAYCC